MLIEKKTSSGTKLVEKSTLRSEAVMSVVNEMIGNHNFPASFRSFLMQFLYEGVTNNTVRKWQGYTKKEPGVLQTRYMITLNTPITPYEFSDKKRSFDTNGVSYVGGVSLKRYLETVAQLFCDGSVNPLKGLSQDQLKQATKASYRVFSLKGENSFAEIVK